MINIIGEQLQSVTAMEDHRNAITYVAPSGDYIHVD